MIEKNFNLRLMLTDEIGNVDALVTDTKDGTIVIAVNSQRSRSEQLIAAWHELTHVIRGDLDRGDMNKAEKECRADMAEAAARILATSNKLLSPCPRCGADPEVITQKNTPFGRLPHRYDRLYYVRCPGCGIRSKGHESIHSFTGRPFCRELITNDEARSAALTEWGKLCTDEDALKQAEEKQRLSQTARERVMKERANNGK